ncbi:MAG: diadenylate cyclase CdaA [Bacteroidales bacterium]|nr:diadenylate cyclase CdaA [Bacteroidales bacterium]
MLPLAIQGLPHIVFTDILDILFVSFLVYEVYRLMRGTDVMRIFWGILIIVAIWLLTSLLHMRISSEILRQVVSVGLVAIIVVFQPEIRRLLLLVGTKTTMAGDTTARRFRLFKKGIANAQRTNFEPYIQACMHMSQSCTGALIIFARQNDISDILSSGEPLEAIASSALIENIFFKNTPLHDGALVVRGNKLLAARCILPVSSNHSIDPNLGLRHRSAIGATEQSDVVAVIVSEETGAISYAEAGVIHHNVSPVELRRFLEETIG